MGWVALGFVIGAFLGAKLLPSIPPAALRGAFGLALLYVGFMFVLAPRSPRPVAAILPAALATLATPLFARLLRRSLQRPQGQPAAPSQDIQYHI